MLPKRSVRAMSAKTENAKSEYWSPTSERNDIRHENRVPVQYLPSFGTIWFVHDGSLFLVSCQPMEFRIGPRKQLVPVGTSVAPEGHEPLLIMRLGRSMKPLKQFLDTCRDFAEEQRRDYVTIRTSKKSVYSEACWSSVILRPVRPMETIHFDEEVKKRLLRDISHYLEPSTRQYYVKRGIPYRRGYLLHGPPGTGKTSLSLALASYFKIDLYLCHLPSVRDDGALEDQFAKLPPKCVILLEDIDAVGVQRRRGLGGEEESDSENSDDGQPLRRAKKKSKFNYSSHNPGCSLAGLLNVLDGVASQEGRIVLMTSNFADRLDKALVRPGRIDHMIFLGYISRISAEKMFLRMYAPSETESGDHGMRETKTKHSFEELEKFASEFSAQIPEGKFTPAQIQGFLLGRKREPDVAVAEIGDWVREEIRLVEEAEALARERAERKQQRKEKRREAKEQLVAPHDQMLARSTRVEVNGVEVNDAHKGNPIKNAIVNGNGCIIVKERKASPNQEADGKKEEIAEDKARLEDAEKEGGIGEE